eukprot:6182460-Pleurochrysis_carterae.AAC.3
MGTHCGLWAGVKGDGDQVACCHNAAVDVRRKVGSFGARRNARCAVALATPLSVRTRAGWNAQASCSVPMRTRVLSLARGGEAGPVRSNTSFSVRAILPSQSGAVLPSLSEA